MRLTRRPPEPEIVIHLDELLEPYFADRVPAPEHQAIAAVPCERCGKPIVYAARSRPGACPWCEFRLRIDLEREDRRSGSRAARVRRR